MTLKQHIAHALAANPELSQAGMARACGISRASVNGWFSGKTDSIDGKYLTTAALYLGVNPHWLATGRGEMMYPFGNTQPVTIRSRAPLISWAAAGKIVKNQVMFCAPAENFENIETETELGGGSFALKVEGDSMTSPAPGEQSFPEGIIIVVDPSVPAAPGDFVIARDPRTDEATFKRLVRDAGHWYLKPMNPAYPTVEIDDPAVQVIGRVVEVQMRRRL
jgi:SOS-response transcriptional repressor LexA